MTPSTSTDAEEYSMRKNRYHIEMENVSRFPLERSTDCQEWEEVSHEELDEILDQVAENKASVFLGVVRGGSLCKLEGYFYRIRPQS
jgi:hemerythrin-like domain-containing protein